jgi:hypothetical protein
MYESLNFMDMCGVPSELSNRIPILVDTYSIMFLLLSLGGFLDYDHPASSPCFGTDMVY